MSLVSVAEVTVGALFAAAILALIWTAWRQARPHTADED